MSEEEHISEFYPQEDAPDEEYVQRPRRSLWGLITLGVVVATVIAALLMLRDCGAGTADTSDRGGKSIGSVSGRKPTAGMVSVWLQSGAQINAVLASADVDHGSYVDMGDSRWVVEVTPGSEKKAARAISRQKGVHDAGLVYER